MGATHSSEREAPLRIGLVTLAAATVVLFTAPSFAADETPSGAPDRNEIICKEKATATGTRLGAHRICKTRGEWLDQEQADRELVSQAQSSSLRAMPPEGGAGSVH